MKKVIKSSICVGKEVKHNMTDEEFEEYVMGILSKSLFDDMKSLVEYAKEDIGSEIKYHARVTIELPENQE